MASDTASNTSKSPSPDTEHSRKRSATTAGLDGNGNGNSKPVKRRAAKACAACRARKVRCDVMQAFHSNADGSASCSNCTMDSIPCVIEESKRRRKQIGSSSSQPAPKSSLGQPQNWPNGTVSPSDLENQNDRRWSTPTSGTHTSHSIYQNASQSLGRNEFLRRQSYMPTSYGPEDPTYKLLTSVSMSGDRTKTRLDSPPPPQVPLPRHKLPNYLKPLPAKLTSVDIDYLFAKSALIIPERSIRNALFRAYVEYVHPYMPLVELFELLKIIDDDTGKSGQMSLLLFQAIMFAGTAFVDMETLGRAGYSNRKAARKAFFQKARVLYDFDVENDRVALVQSLLLMTYWYETPDDQKDTWHWMGVAISLAHTIGLHRNPEASSMPTSTKKLWKRIWWSCFMRDRLVALGMRRPTRVKPQDYDVPMLEENDFEIAVLPENNSVIPPECTLMRDVEAQRQLAQMCIAKAQLCLCISHVLSAQYSVLVKHQGMQGQEGSTRSSVMLFPKKLDQTDEVQQCDAELRNWISTLPVDCEYSELTHPDTTSSPLFVQNSLLHMIYFTTVSALHRPQVLPSASTTQPDQTREMQDMSRRKVRDASKEITRISSNLYAHGLEKYLPTTGVTVLLPAIIIHLLDIKSSNEAERKEAVYGFTQCMLVLEKLRDNYSSADFATSFLEAAIKKADIETTITQHTPSSAQLQRARLPSPEESVGSMTNGDLQRNLQRISEHNRLRKEARTRISEAANANNHTSIGFARRITPPSDSELEPIVSPTEVPQQPVQDGLDDADRALLSNIGFLQGNSSTVQPINRRDMNSSLESCPPIQQAQEAYPEVASFEDPNFEMSDFLNFDGTIGIGGIGDAENGWSFGIGAHGESGGFMGDEDLMGYASAFSRVGSPAREFAIEA